MSSLLTETEMLTVAEIGQRAKRRPASGRASDNQRDAALRLPRRKRLIVEPRKSLPQISRL